MWQPEWTHQQVKTCLQSCWLLSSGPGGHRWRYIQGETKTKPWVRTWELKVRATSVRGRFRHVEIHGSRGRRNSPGQGGREIHLQQPGLQIGVNEDVETVQLCKGAAENKRMHISREKGETSAALEAQVAKYQHRWSFIAAPEYGNTARCISAVDYTHVMHQITKACYWGLGLVTSTKYIHIWSVMELLAEGVWSKTRWGCEYFRTWRGSFSHYGGG